MRDWFRFTGGLVVAVLIGLLTIALPVRAQDQTPPKSIQPVETSAAATTQPTSTVPIYFFWSHSCPHCSKAEPFLKQLDQDNDQIEVIDFEISQRRNALLLQKVGQYLDVPAQGVPFIVIGDQAVVGYLDDQTQGEQIKKLAENCLQSGQCPDVLAELKLELAPTPDPASSESKNESTQSSELTQIKLPFIGQLEVADFSLPVLTIIIALVDGFNPCAMWTLLFLISLLLGMQDRRRMWILGTAFIVSSAFVYLLFLTAWLNLFLFIGFIPIVRLLIGLVALGAGIYNLYDYCTNRDGGCKVSNNKRRREIFEKLKAVAQRPQLWLALTGIVMLAFAVNMVELVCSAGLPAIFTQLLAINQLPHWQYPLYLLLYIFIFMVDDLFVFFAAMTTLHMVGIENKYARYSRLIGGVIILIIGILLILKPEILMMG